jgi:hypothetical protein
MGAKLHLYVGGKMEATLHLYVGGNVEARLDVAPFIPLRFPHAEEGIGHGQASP